VEGATGIELV
jgi:hypothetical protein